MRWVDSPNKADDYDAKKEMRGRMQALKAHKWVTSHPDTFEELCGIVRTLPSDHLRDRVNLVCMERGIKVADRNTSASFAHAMWAPIIRYMVLSHPELKDNPIVFSKACVDYSGLPELEGME